MGKKRVTTLSGVEEKQVSPEAKAKKKISLPIARIYINAKWNNTFATLTDDQGNVYESISTGQVGFKGTKKSTPYAGSRVVELLVERLKNYNLEKIKVFVSGFGPGRDSALKTLFSKDLPIVMIEDITPVPFGGPRPPKVRRV